jgi:PHS family inorganic phosphate transporter-like MFS transporter
MVNRIVFALATGIALLTDKFMLESTNYVEHYATDMSPSQEQKEFIKSAMYAGAILGMVSFGPISDTAGRRVCLIACSLITFLGAVLSACAWSSNALIAARVITGIGMGGEYPLASTHSSEAASDSNKGARNVGLLYLFGSGGGPALAALVTYFLDLGGMPPQYIWRGIFLVGCILALIGLVLRVVTTEDSQKFVEARKKNPRGTTRNFIKHYWKPLLGTSLIWFLFDIVEYGLKQNDAGIFEAVNNGPYRNNVLEVFLSRLLVVPSLAFAPWLLTKLSSKHVQLIGFAGCVLANFLLAVAYEPLHKSTVIFGALYIVQLSFQSLPGVTTMAISAEIYPSAVRGTGAAISAASGKLGATVGSFFITMLNEMDMINTIFWVISGTSCAALLLTFLTTPRYNGTTLDMAEQLAVDGDTKKAVKVLYGGPQKEPMKEAETKEQAQIEDAEAGSSSHEMKV